MNYKINEHHVATNPIVETLYSKGREELEICYAEKNNKWSYGIHYALPTAGGGGLPSFSENMKLYNSKEEARELALKRLLENIKSCERFENRHYKHLTDIIELELTGKQLSLFQ